LIDPSPGWGGRELQPATPLLFAINNLFVVRLDGNGSETMNWFKSLVEWIKMRRKGYVLMQGEDGSWWWVGYD
jgi:hypothetical protein